MTFPYKSSNHVHQIEVPFDYNSRRAILAEGSENVPISWTLVQDTANVIAQIADYEDEWPVDGGVAGSKMSINDVLAIGEKIRGK